VDPGEFDKRVSLIRLDHTGRDAAGAPQTQRVQFARPWAKVVYPGGREFLAGDGEVTERRVVFRFYRQAGVDLETIVVHGGVDHDVQDIRPFDDVMELHTVSKAAPAS
jgi:head-tail adaptor